MSSVWLRSSSPSPIHIPNPTDTATLMRDIAGVEYCMRRDTLCLSLLPYTTLIVALLTFPSNHNMENVGKRWKTHPRYDVIYWIPSCGQGSEDILMLQWRRACRVSRDDAFSICVAVLCDMIIILRAQVAPDTTIYCRGCIAFRERESFEINIRNKRVFLNHYKTNIKPFKTTFSRFLWLSGNTQTKIPRDVGLTSFEVKKTAACKHLGWKLGALYKLRKYLPPLHSAGVK